VPREAVMGLVIILPFKTLGALDGQKYFHVPHKNITISRKCIDLHISV